MIHRVLELAWEASGWWKLEAGRAGRGRALGMFALSWRDSRAAVRSQSRWVTKSKSRFIPEHQFKRRIESREKSQVNKKKVAPPTQQGERKLCSSIVKRAAAAEKAVTGRKQWYDIRFSNSSEAVEIPIVTDVVLRVCDTVKQPETRWLVR